MTEATFTFRVDEALEAEFTEAAKAEDRTGAQPLRDFMGEFVRRRREGADYDAWLLRKVANARASADFGDVVSAEEVEAEAAAWRADIRRKLAAPAS